MSDELPYDLPAAEALPRAVAILEGVSRRAQELATDPRSPTLASVLEPLDRLLLEVRNVEAHGALLFHAHAEEAVRDAGREIMQRASARHLEILGDRAIFERLKAIESTELDPEARHARERLLHNMRRAGAESYAATRTRVHELRTAMEALEGEYTANLGKWSRTLTLAEGDATKGLGPEFVRAHQEGPGGPVTFTARPADANRVLERAEDPETRRRVLELREQLGAPENAIAFRKLLALRTDLARLSGHRNFAEHVLADRMLKDPGEVHRFLDGIASPVRSAAQVEFDRLSSMKVADGKPGPLEAWDETFYLKRWREERGESGRSRARLTYPYPTVRDGLFRLCLDLFGLSFVRNPGAVVWAPGVEAYDVSRDGVPTGQCYLDPLPRPGKFPGGAMAPIRYGTRDTVLPAGALVMPLFDRVEPLESAVLPHPKVVGFFHEFGHLIHHLLAGQQRFAVHGFSGLEWDFVEVPSKLFEELAWDPEVLRQYLGTPEEALPRGRKASDIGVALRRLRSYAMAEAAIRIYSSADSDVDAGAIIRATFRERSLFRLSEGAVPEAGSGVLVGYSASCYAYLLGEVLAFELLSPFRESGSYLQPDLGRRFAEIILAPGASRPALDLVQEYLGRPYSIERFAEAIRPRAE